MNIGHSIYSISTLLIALFCVHAPRGRYRAPFFVVVSTFPLLSLFLMAEVPVPIPPDAVVAALPAAEAAAEVPAAGDKPVAPAEASIQFNSRGKR